MSKRASRKPGEEAPQVYRKPRADIYTFLLVVALMAIILATTVLWMTMKEYDNLIKGGPTPVWHRPAVDSPWTPSQVVT